MKYLKRLFFVFFIFGFLFFLASCKNKITGTYYLYEKDDYDKESYFILEKDKWKDDDNASGDYTISGDKITLYIDFFGFKEELCSGTIKDGVMLLEGLGSDKYYCKEGKIPPQTSTSHTHQFSSMWTFDKTPTCTEVGSKSHHCLECGEKKDVTSIPATGHNFSEWTMTKVATEETRGSKERKCEICKYVEKIEIRVHKHQYGSWLAHGDEHWEICRLCDYINKQEHEFKIENSTTLKCEVCQQEKEVNHNLKFTLSEDGKSYIVDGFDNDYSQILIIPNEYNGLPVTAINDSAFENEGLGSLREVYIDEGITRIGNKAFMGIKDLTKVKLPNSLQILGDSSFENSGLEDIDLHNTNLVSIGTRALANCHQIEKISMPSTLELVGEGALSGCSNLRELNLQFIGGSLESSGASKSTLFGYIFGTTKADGCYAATQRYSETGEQITYYIPEKLEKVTIETGKIHLGAFSHCRNIVELELKPKLGEEVPAYLFEYCGKLEQIYLQRDIKGIGQDAFYGCNSLTNLYYEGTIEDWCNIEFNFDPLSNPMTYADHFYLKNSNNEWKEVTGIEIPNTITEIKNYQFYGFNNVTSITIPGSVKNIRDSAFDICFSLSNIYYEGTIEDWCNIRFNDPYSNPMTYAGHFYLRNSHNEWEEVTSIEIPKTITEIGVYQFYGFNNVTSITISDSVTSIGEKAFSSCSSLTSITIPTSVTSIGKEAFNACDNLTSIIISASVTTIAYSAFLNCRSLKEVYYDGTASQWNFDLNFPSTTIYFYSETTPTEEGNYWHFVDGVPTKWN